MNEDNKYENIPSENEYSQNGINEPAPVVEPVPAVEPAPVAEPAPAVEPTPAVEPAPVEDPTPAAQNSYVWSNAPVYQPEPTSIPQQHSYVWNGTPAPQNDRKATSSTRIFLRSLLAIILVALIVLAAFGVASLVRGGSGTDKPAPQSSSESSVEPKEGFQIKPRSDEDDLSVKEIAAKVRPAVVGVVNYSMNSLTANGYGSGVIINSEGYIVTNNHVIEGADRVKVVLYDETEALANIIGYDEQTDLAVLRIIEDENIKYSDLKVATFGSSDELQLAETVIAIGNPGGLEFAGTVTRGIVSGLNVKTDLSGTVKLIQTDAAINPGNSGGPLIDTYGNVIGITSQKIVDTQYEGMGFAIPSNTVKPIVDNIITYGYVPGRPMLGITGNDIDEYVAYFNNVPQGVLIASVDADSDLAAKGIKKNDIITSFNGVTIKTMDELNTEKEKCAAGDTVEIGIYRYSNASSFTVKVKLSEYKPD